MPAEPGLFIGLDCGTQSSKACAWDVAGRPIRSAGSPLPISSPREGWAEQDPRLWWSSACAALRTASAGLDPSRIGALGLAFQRESFSLLDHSGTPCRPAILWLDVRASEEVDEVGRILGADACHRLSGKPLDVTAALPRLLWLRRHEPEALSRATRWVDVGSFLIERLTGRFATCRAGADTCGLVDLATGGWRQDWLEALGFGNLAMPELLDAGALAGLLQPEAAREAGLPAGLPVVAAGGDGQVLRVGLGCPEREGWSLTLGTSIVLGLGTPSGEVSAAWRTLLAAAPRGAYLREAVLQSGTFALRWLEDAVAKSPGSDTAGEQMLAAIPAGSEGLLAFPHLWGARFPSAAPEARGAFVGLTHRHTPAHFHRALLEGIAFELRRMKEAMASEAASRRGLVAVTGGGARNRRWLGIIASTLGRTVAVPNEPESTALGAAMLAACSVGRFPSLTKARVMAGAVIEVRPDPGLESAYEVAYSRSWLPTLERLLPLSTKLAGLAP